MCREDRTPTHGFEAWLTLMLHHGEINGRVVGRKMVLVLMSALPQNTDNQGPLRSVPTFPLTASSVKGQPSHL